uniref:Uncharacterized protein n=1 Tax=Corvus moneduloides TaxID=1196302 RepID=A0A8C3EJ55_CORMO
INCRSGARRLPALLGAVLRELRRAGNTSAGAGGSLYILLIIIFCGCRAGALIPAETRSRKLESKHDPSHLYTERDCGPGGPAQAAEQGGPAAGVQGYGPGQPDLMGGIPAHGRGLELDEL